MTKKIVALLLAITLITIASGCLGNNTSPTSTVTQTETVTKTNTIVSEKLVTTTVTMTSVQFMSTTFYVTTLITLSIVTTVYVSGSLTTVFSPSASTTLIYTYDFGNVPYIVKITSNNTVFITLPLVATVFKPELEGIASGSEPPAAFTASNYYLLIWSLEKYTVKPLWKPVIVSNTMGAEYFGANLAVANAHYYGRATIVKVFVNNVPVGEYLFENGVYYGTRMTYHPAQFSGIIHSKYGTATLYYLVIDSKGMPVNFFTNIVNSGSYTVFTYSKVYATINSTTVYGSNGTFELIYTSSTSTITTTYGVSEVSQIDILYPLVATLNDAYPVSDGTAFGFIYLNDTEVVFETLVPANINAYSFTATIYVLPFRTKVITGLVVKS